MKKLFFKYVDYYWGTSLFCSKHLEKNAVVQWNLKRGKYWKIKSFHVCHSESDYWRISHYGFTVDDAPFYYVM